MSAVTRRRWQFRLRTLVAAMAVVGICCGWAGNITHHYRVEQSAIREIPRVAYVDLEWTGPIFLGETWVEAASPVLNRAVGINFADTELTDEQFAKLPLDRLRRLRWINLGAGEVISARFYRYEPTRITDEALRHLWKCPRLEGLSLWETKITDAGLPLLAQCPNLTGLDLDETLVTDTGLESLLQFPNLQHLSLAQTSTSDAALDHLQRMKQLEYLDVRDTNVTDDGVARLQTALPHCEIRH
jgi:hypothetical protein